MGQAQNAINFSSHDIDYTIISASMTVYLARTILVLFLKVKEFQLFQFSMTDNLSSESELLLCTIH